MSIKVAIRHQTSYTYDRAVNLSPHVFRLRPAPHCRTPILAYSFRVEPAKHFINWQQDPFGNYQARVVFPDPMTKMVFEVEVIADIIVINPFDFFLEKTAETFPISYPEQLRKELQPYFEVTESGPLLNAFVRELDITSQMRTIDFLVDLNQRLWKRLRYTVRFEPGVQTCEETLTLNSGSCRDSGWLLVQAMRQLGMAARFVSGYLIQLKADTQALDGPSGPAADFTDLHAWAEVYIPGAGWIGLDPTSGLFAGEGHIPLCCTPHPVSAAPVTGLTDVCEVQFSYKNEVFRVQEDPRVTKPFTDQQWMEIMALGTQVDEALQKSDMRLTMGGEPTFISVDDMEAKEWNTDADGPQKRKAGSQLIRRLRNAFGPGGVIHRGQGKWYPGESLPRWQYTAIWRKDGFPVWRDDSRLDLEDDPDGKPFNAADAQRFATALTRYLGIPETSVHEAVEDAVFFLWEENKVPDNLDPYQANLNDPLERKKLAEVLAQGLGNAVGYVVPLEWNHTTERWTSCQWAFRHNRVVLLPGNSAMGYRLPLKSLPFLRSARTQKPVERSTFEELNPFINYFNEVDLRSSLSDFKNTLPKEYIEYKVSVEESGHEHRHGHRPTLNGKEVKPSEPAPEEEPYTIKTALCVEVREGKLHVFLPPVAYAEHFLDLVAAIEKAAEKENVRVVLEGYAPPHDNRLQRLSLAPDPGVLEVNIHPAGSWQEIVHNYDVLFEEARLSRLSPEKFMLDGKHTGTGGGNHITIGGASPADSPLLRKPQLLRSLITYWQHHPGLSYLFSSPFIGPTSQAPRVDEGRQEMLYELEIAFNQIPDDGEVPFWLVDRIFRNLLVDITGNTHRAEFCIDKLYSPDSSTGRLGLLEFRAFDMPPNKQMCLVQLLLIRSLLAWLWEKPYKKKLIRWGTRLYDRFMLPYYVQQDLAAVIDDLNDAGFPFQLAWLDTFFEFRFPMYGKVRVEDMVLELRFAIEPWHVLGEETARGGTARYVDASVERVEVRVAGYRPDRYLVTCNQQPVPMEETAVAGVYVGGVRYRAWSPPSALHPTLGTDVPLVFDLVDTWNGKSMGGCRYHVAHPGGRSYETFPVNAYEAEARRISRFFDYGHTPGPVTSPVIAPATRYLEKIQNPIKFDPPPLKISPEYPHTLDLRQH